MVALRERMAKLIAEGKSAEEAVAAKPTADFDAKWANGPVRPNQLVEELYRSEVQDQALGLARPAADSGPFQCTALCAS